MCWRNIRFCETITPNFRHFELEEIFYIQLHPVFFLEINDHSHTKAHHECKQDPESSALFLKGEGNIHPVQPREES